MYKVRIDITGKRYGNLVVLGYAFTRVKRAYWYCKCDCGIIKVTQGGLLRRGEAKSCGCGRKGINVGEKNKMWKGDKVGKLSLHEWVRRRLPKPKVCECCKKDSPRDIANISQEYKRRLNDWEWLCRRCHMKKDGRLKNLRSYGRKNKTS